MKKVLITGAAGRIGTIIFEDLKDRYQFTGVDVKPVPGIECLDIAKDYQGLCALMAGHDAVIHLAWDSRENWKSQVAVPENKEMLENVYRAAVEMGVRRVVMASSIHADDFPNLSAYFSTLRVDRISQPTSIYGATKVYLEALGRYYASRHGLNVFCLRFGGVSTDDQPRQEHDYEKIWLSRRDCANLISRCVYMPVIYTHFHVFYGVSNNANRIHDWENSVDWVPQDDSAVVFKKE
jgi:uronate dehydrogenase